MTEKNIKCVRPVELLLIEDNPADIELTKHALANNAFSVNLSIAMDGEEALDLLKKCNHDSKKQPLIKPDIILLDLHLPTTSGYDVLKYIRSTDGLKHIPVVILTASNSYKDIEKIYALGATSYITKPVDFDVFVETIHTLGSYWFQLVTYPAA